MKKRLPEVKLAKINEESIMKNKLFIGIALTLLSALWLEAADPVKPDSPNIILILTDDQGWSHVPTIVSWQGKIDPGTSTDALFSSIDFFPTLLEAWLEDTETVIPVPNPAYVPKDK